MNCRLRGPRRDCGQDQLIAGPTAAERAQVWTQHRRHFEPSAGVVGLAALDAQHPRTVFNIAHPALQHFAGAQPHQQRRGDANGQRLSGLGVMLEGGGQKRRASSMRSCGLPCCTRPTGFTAANGFAVQSRCSTAQLNKGSAELEIQAM